MLVLNLCNFSYIFVNSVFCFLIFFLDDHDVVLRFNHAPTEEYDADVGQKTTVRVVNSQVVSKPEYNFLESPLYKDIKIVAWDPSKYNHTMDQVELLCCAF